MIQYPIADECSLEVKYNEIFFYDYNHSNTCTKKE